VGDLHVDVVNTMAGLSIVSQAAPIFQEMGKASAAAAAGLVGVISVGNGVGRIFWAWIIRFDDA